MSSRTKGNAKHLFKTDISDGWLRKIPNSGHFGHRSIPELGLYGLHIGTDYGADIGEELIAYDDYEVLSTSGHSDYGKQVFLYFPKINKTGHYAHMDSIYVKVGQTGKARDVIGTSGNTGLTGGPHLHFSFGSGRITSTHKDHAWEDFEKYVYALINSNVKEHKENGEITVTVDVGLRVRQSPSLSARQTDLLPKGTKKVYTHYVDADGIRWVKLKEGGYVARRTLDNKTIYADAKFLEEKPQPSVPSSKFQFKVGDVLEISGHYPTVHNGSFISTPKKHVIVKKIFPKDHYPYQVTDEKGNILGGVDPVNVYRVVKRRVKPTPDKSIVKGSKVNTTAKKDIFGTNLDPDTVNANKTFTVEQVGRNGNNNHILLKEIMTWVEKSTLKVM